MAKKLLPPFIFGKNIGINLYSQTYKKESDQKMKTRSEVWEEYNRLQEILKANIEKEIYNDELVGKINALYWVLDYPYG